MKTRSLLSFGVMAAVLGAAGSAHATTYTQTVQFGPGPTDYNFATGFVNGTPATTFYFFDTAAGDVLNSVTISSSYRFTSTITLTNTSQASSSGTVNAESAVQFAASYNGQTVVPANIVNTYTDPVVGSSFTYNGTTISPIAYDLRGSNASYSLNAGGSQTFASTGTLSTNSMVDTNPSEIAAFETVGSSTFTPLFSTLSGFNLSNSGGATVVTSAQTIATGTMTITYDYSPAVKVAEPASMLVLGAGLMGLGLVRRRRT